MFEAHLLMEKNLNLAKALAESLDRFGFSTISHNDHLGLRDSLIKRKDKTGKFLIVIECSLAVEHSLFVWIRQTTMARKSFKIIAVADYNDCIPRKHRIFINKILTILINIRRSFIPAVKELVPEYYIKEKEYIF